MTPLLVFLVGDDPLARRALSTLLEAREGIQLVGHGASTEEAGRQLADLRPDLVLWDLGWGAGLDLEALESIGASDLPIVALVSGEEAAASAWSAGLRNLLPRQIGPETLVRALLAAAEGLTVIDSALTRGLVPPVSQDSESDPLTPREIEVLQLMAEGLPNKGIAARLAVSEHTAKFHVNAILRKMGAQSRTEAVVRATRQGLILL